MALNPAEIRVALLAGGTSGEKEISKRSGEGAKAALVEAGYEVETIDPANKDELKRLFEEHFDVAFLCLHGKGGEDGTIQGLLETLRIPYTCSHVQASAIAMDKNKSKILYTEAGIPTAPSVTLQKGDEYNVNEIVETIGVPCVVKAATEGSSLGVEIIFDADEVGASIERVFEIDNLLIIEKYIAGDEFTVAVLGNRDPETLPIIKIVPQNDSYDFESKYAPGGSEHICPAPLDENIAGLVRDLAKRAHNALGCSGVSRSDFIVGSDGKPWILETNTIPGMTATSLLPDAAKAAGIPFPDLCTKLIEFAME